MVVNQPPPWPALGRALVARGWMLATAESCTGGLVAAACTDVPGASAWFERGYVTYANTAKTDALGVPAALIARHGAVSEAVARAMAAGVLAHAAAQVALAITGIAGPGGGSAAKPVGTVWFGLALPGRVLTDCRHFPGDRAAVRQAAAAHAGAWVLACVQAREDEQDEQDGQAGQDGQDGQDGQAGQEGAASGVVAAPAKP